MRHPVTFLSILCISCLFGLTVEAANSHATSANPAGCYDAADPHDIRLWDGPAPGAKGDDPCRDIPHMKVFPAREAKAGSGTAILLIPGGGYDRLTNLKEQVPVADYFSQTINATTFLLYYRLVQTDGTYRYPVAMWDGQRALKLIRSRAREFGIDPKRIGMFGFSAGGHLSSTLALHADSDFKLPKRDAVDATDARPDFLGLGYAVISMNPEQYGKSYSHDNLLNGFHGTELTDLEKYLSAQDHVTEHTPPVFLFVSLDDQRINPQNSVMFAQALKAANIPVEAHMFEHGAHGVGLATDMAEEHVWPEMFHHWLEQQHFLPQPD